MSSDVSELRTLLSSALLALRAPGGASSDMSELRTAELCIARFACAGRRTRERTLGKHPTEI